MSVLYLSYSENGALDDHLMTVLDSWEEVEAQQLSGEAMNHYTSHNLRPEQNTDKIGNCC